MDTGGAIPHGGALIERRLATTEADELANERQLPSLTLTPAETADLRALATGAYSPLDGFMNAKQHQACAEGMRLPDGTLWPIPVCLGLADGEQPHGDRVALRGERGEFLGVLEVEEVFERDRVAAPGRERPDPRGGRPAQRAGGPLRAHAGGDPRGLRRARLEHGGRVPDPQPRAPRARVPDEGGPGDLRRAAAAPAGGADQGGRRARRGAHARLPRDPRVLSAGARDAGGPGRAAALRRSPRGRAARPGPQELRLHPLHRRPRPRRRRQLLRHLRGAGADLLAAVGGPRHHPAAVRQRLLLPALRRDGHRQDLPAPARGPPDPLRDPGPRQADRRRAATAGVQPAGGRRDPHRRLPGAGELTPSRRPDRSIPTPGDPTSMNVDNGFVIWLTGLSGAGKSTIANAVAPSLAERGHRVEVLDGDEVRTNLCQGLGFSREDRDTNIARIGYVAGKLAKHGVAVVVAAISPYREARDRVRASVENFVEVHVAAPVSTCAERDVKGLYAKALAGEIKNFTGVSDPYEEPLEPEIALHTEHETVQESVDQVLAWLEAKGLSVAVGEELDLHVVQASR